MYNTSNSADLIKIGNILALAHMAELPGCHPARPKFTSSIPGQGTCLSCGPVPQLGHV